MYHTPVLLTETLDQLALQPGDQVIDATLGDGGHSIAMLERIGLDGRLLGIDASPVSLDRARQRIGDDPRVTLVHANFAELRSAAQQVGFSRADAILFDLGVASWQLGLDDDGETPFDPSSSAELRKGQGILGLSFAKDEFLDMRLDPRLQRTAADIVNRATPGELMMIFEEYGGLTRSKALVDRVVALRRQLPIITTRQLVDLIGSQSPRALAPLFQALRMAVNDELSVLSNALEQAIALLGPGGRLAVISFHSGEDRIVKRLFRSAEQAGQIALLTDRPMSPSEAELRHNSRSRSAKLRTARTYM